MKHLLPIILALVTTSVIAQAPDWTKAGHHLDRAGADKHNALFAAVAGGAFTAFAYHLDTKAGKQSHIPTTFAAVTIGLSVGFTISSGGHLRKAGKVLQP